MIGKLGKRSETMSKCGFGTKCFFCSSDKAKGSVRQIIITNVGKIGMDIYHVTNSTDEFQKRSEIDQAANQKKATNSDGEAFQRLGRCAQTFERSRQRRQREAEDLKLRDDFEFLYLKSNNTLMRIRHDDKYWKDENSNTKKLALECGERNQLQNCATKVLRVQEYDVSLGTNR